jgi:hypothetical protein
MADAGRRIRGMRRVLLALVVTLGVPVTVFAGPDGPIVERLTDGGASISLGFGVAPLRPQLVPPIVGGAASAEAVRPVDAEAQAKVMSFDLKLRWPGADPTVLPLEPYLSVGPALFVLEPDYVNRLLGTRVDPTLRLGAKAGVGLNWRVGKDTTLFGAYEATTASPGAPAPGARSAADNGVNGFDFTYGLRIRY